MTNHGHMYARGNGATEKGSPDMHSIFKIYEMKSTPILIRHLLPFSSIRGEVADTRVEIETKKKISFDDEEPPSPSSPPCHSNLRCHIL
jgi:hypothetical protein